MSVPQDDMLCRFIRGHKDYWSESRNRPRPPAFKENDGLSVWNLNSLHQKSVKVDELRKGPVLDGCGQAHHTAGDYLATAKKAGAQNCSQLDITVEWRPENQFVKPEWRDWAYAHVQVEYAVGMDWNAVLESAAVYFRQELSKNARHTVPPDKYLKTS